MDNSSTVVVYESLVEGSRKQAVTQWAFNGGFTEARQLSHQVNTEYMTAGVWVHTYSMCAWQHKRPSNNWIFSVACCTRRLESSISNQLHAARGSSGTTFTQVGRRPPALQKTAAPRVTKLTAL